MHYWDNNYKLVGLNVDNQWMQDGNQILKKNFHNWRSQNTIVNIIIFLQV